VIPVFEPIIGDEEIEAVIKALRRGEISGSFGESLHDFEQEFANFCGCKYGIAVSSGTTALHLAIAAAGVSGDDEVLLSSSTNIATALAVVHNGGCPVPVDSESVTWNLDLDLLEKMITPRTRAIIPVHLFGHPVDMDRLMDIAQRHRLLVVEDCAEAHGATCRGKVVGSFGDMGCFSFYANKVITTGEGGMIVTNDTGLAEKCRLLRNLGFTQPRFKHEVLGYNFRMTGYQAAMGLAQLHKIDKIIADKRRVAQTYKHYLKDVPGLQLPTELDWAFNVYWMFAINLLPEFGVCRDDLISRLQSHGIETRTFFCPMNQQPCLKKHLPYNVPPCPVADGLWKTGLYLPSAHSLSEENIAFISSAIKNISIGSADLL
jgi:perosamine synthetase